MTNMNELPSLDFEAGAPGAQKHRPVAVLQVVAGVVIGIAIAATN